MKVLMSGSAVHATKKWMHIYMHFIRQCMFVCVSVCTANWRWNVAVEFLVDSMPTHLFLFVKRSLILLLAHTHGHTLIETFVLVFSCCYFCGCIAPPQMTPPHAAHALYLCLSCCVRVSACVCVTPHAFRDANRAPQSTPQPAHFSFSCSVRSLSFHSAALCYPCQRRRRGRRR